MMEHKDILVKKQKLRENKSRTSYNGNFDFSD